jgi:D-citramalate synthase
LNVDRIEIASASKRRRRVSRRKRNHGLGARKGYTNRIEVLTLLMVAFLLHGCKTGAKVQNLLTKGSMNHLKHQLTPEQHFSEIAQTITLAKNIILLLMFT